MATPQPISQLSKSFEKASLTVSTSPTQSYLDQYKSLATQAPTKVLKPFNAGDVKILLLENVNQTALDIFQGQGYQIEFHKTSLSDEELIEKIKDVHAIGIRSKTRLTAEVLKHAKNLVAIGCFCIGTNQVDLEFAATNGIAVFNSPFSNSRSVAELTIAEIVLLSRQLGDRNIEMHQGIWNKVSAKCWEVRGKTLGIIGYGHIGSQLSVLAESMGMNVLYHDVLMIMSMGNSKQVSSLTELLNNSDFVSLHVPELPDTVNMISTPQLAEMKDGAYLINNSRGTVVDIPALVDALKVGKLAGACIDVYPKEPRANGEFFNGEHLLPFIDDLKSLKNVLLTPHIGGSTEEAQSAIGIEVGTVLTKYLNEGASIGAVNFPEVALRGLDLEAENVCRVLYIHKNVPGVLKVVNQILADHNIEKQFSDSRGEVAYLMADVSGITDDDIKRLYNELEATPFNISTRLLY